MCTYTHTYIHLMPMVDLDSDYLMASSPFLFRFGCGAFTLIKLSESDKPDLVEDETSGKWKKTDMLHWEFKAYNGE